MPTYRRVCLLLLACAATALAAQAAPPLPGAIFTTNAGGTRVNQNQFPAECDVYLDGGPGPNAPQQAAGLPDGDYYFQVTDPSGQTLLSTDAVKFRQFHVNAGIISGLSGSGNHGTGSDVDHGGTTIQLCDFDPTPNPGGVYKVWVTPVGDFSGDVNVVDNGYHPGYFHGFIPAASKTDNFKIGQQPTLPCLVVEKFIDKDRDGTFNFYVDPIVPWPLHIFDDNGAQINGTIYTTTTKECVALNLTPGTYRIEEEATDGSGLFVVTANYIDGRLQRRFGTSVSVRIRSASVEVTFGNAPKK
ncbi:MAG TPA: hypothetical protein VJS92_08255 [Candidatus Polarisedimenticolaceae bacterium]|nr:hypothetical protein [Candidatus Polarisedimenticolaceae bacterium]